MSVSEFISIHEGLGMSDRKLAEAIGVTRQTVRNWRKGSICPQFAINAMRWLVALRNIDPTNDNLPECLRHTERIEG